MGHSTRRAHPHENNPFILGMGSYKSVTQIFASVLKSSTNLHTLVLCNLEPSLDFTRRVSEIPTLYTLELHFCHIPRAVRRKLSSDATSNCPQISNLRIYMDSSFQGTHSQWYSLLLCSCLRTLSIIQFGIGPFPTPEQLFWKKCRLQNLERLSLDNTDANDLVALIKFLSRNRASIRLTHFKLHMDRGVSDFEIMDLLIALETARLEVLVLEGLAQAEFPISQCIVFLFPYLVALTLVRRQNRNQHQNKLAPWPHSSWEYPSYFRGFKALRHFCWNFLTEYRDASPASLLAFEAGFASPSATPESKGGSKHVDSDPSDEIPYFLDSHWMALPFAAYCKTLESLSLMDRTVDMVCRINRNPTSGATDLAPKYYPTHGSSVSWDIQQWNTTASHWPILLPDRRSSLA